MLTPKDYALVQEVYERGKALVTLEQNSPGSSFLIHEAEQAFIKALNAVYDKGHKDAMKKVSEQDREAWRADSG